MMEKKLQKKYVELLKGAQLADGRKDTIAYFHKAEKLRNKITKKIKKTCTKCNGHGFRRITIDEAKTCFNCFGRGYLVKEIHNI